MRCIGLAATVLLVSCATPARTQDVPRALAGHYELVPQLQRGLLAPDDAVRARCAFLLGQIGDRPSAGAIRPLLSDSSLAVRRQAGVALCALGDPAGLPATDAVLASAAEWIRYYAVEALAGLATDEARAVLEARRAVQGELVGGQLDKALELWPWPSAAPAPAKEKLEPGESLHELFVEAGGQWVIESDGYWHQGSYPQCVRCNETVVFVDPQHVEMYGTAAWLLWSMGASDRAASILRQGLAANPRDWQMWFDTGFQYVLMGQHAVAARFLGRAADLGAPAEQSRQYCHALEKAGRPAEALEAWRALQRRFPDDPVAPNHIGRLQRLLSGEQEPASET